jgi:phosphoribosylglycinamide formyltransferase-1
MIKLAIFASGSGTNAENLIRYFEKDPSITVALIVCNVPNAGVISRAERLGVPVVMTNRAQLAEGSELSQKLEETQIHAIILAGFLLLIPEWLIKKYPNRILNIHPALLPKYGGKGMYGMRVHEAVIAAGEQESGISVHLVNEKFDEGPVLGQYTCPVEPNDNPEKLAEKIHELEYRYFPKIVEDYLKKLH